MSKYQILTNLKGAISPDPVKLWSVDIVEDAAIVFDDKHIVWFGRKSDIPISFLDNCRFIDGLGYWASPGFVDPHTHLLFGGDRSREFNRRLHGESYAKIASEGGGIWQTVLATRKCTMQNLILIGEQRLKQFYTKGVIHIEVKTGYGLTLESEDRLVKAYQYLKEKGWSLDITLMLAHDIPKEFAGDRDDYVRTIIFDWQPKIVKNNLDKIRFCDIFVEDGIFTNSNGREVLKAGKNLGLIPRIHADEFCSTLGAELSVELNAASADHLMHVSDSGIEALSNSSVIPILLPVTTFFLGMQKFAPARRLIEAGCRVALASDFNPGSSACIDPLLVLRLGCLQLRMTFEEALTAMTLHAAYSLGYSTFGHLHIGGSRKILLWNIKHPLDLVYWIGESFLPVHLDDLL